MPHKILIVDDEVGITEGFKEAFGRYYDISSSNDGEEAIDLIKKNPPELLVLDWLLQGVIEGRDILSLMKQEFPKIPVFVLTASEHFVKEINSLGADTCLLKPCFEPLKRKLLETLPPEPWAYCK
ncbi:MAG: response regulator, partial [Candidatus Omnitrophica bacterium]|nr:response regulator [Candidatus Omnitrophota bacterium]